MNDEQRKDKVQLLLQDQLEHAEKINDYIGKCECEADCHYHKIYLSHQQLTEVLLQEIEDIYMQTTEIKFHLTDFKFLAEEVVSGILNELDSKEYDRTNNNAVRTSEAPKNNRYKRGGMKI